MVGRGRVGRSDTRYFLRFAGTASLLVAGTLVLVLYVLPQRYVLSSGFREGSLVLPDPSTPFEPLDVARIAALPPLPPAIEAELGPAEIFWARVVPMLRAGQYEAAIPIFASYLDEYPGDRDVRREYAITLSAAGYGDRAIPLFAALLAARDDPALRLLYARTLRDQDRVGEAQREYAFLLGRNPTDPALWLESAQSLSWVRQYTRAESVLLEGLARHPDSVPLRVELARVYFSMDRLAEADKLLSNLTETELAESDGITLRDDLRRALTPPPDPEAPPLPIPTTLELAVAAREAGDMDLADSLFVAAVEERPRDADAWEEYANFLQYEREDFAAALHALTEVERLTGEDDPGRQLRMAQLEVWLLETDLARLRLESILAGPAEASLRADVYALLGDLDRWDGDRLQSVRRYEQALMEEPDHPVALEGLALVQAEVDRSIVEAERPHLGAIANSLADTDDFGRLDLGGEWFGIDDDWVWGTRSGGRFVEGVDLTGTSGRQQGLFAELEGARWWRWGTIRTGVTAGLQTIRDGSIDAAIGGSVRLIGQQGLRTDLRFDHEPAYGVANTLQSVLSNVRQDRLRVDHTRPFGEAWVSGLSAEVASIDHVDVVDADRNTRVQGSISVGRVFSRRLTIGLTTRALHYRNAAPEAASLRLYWDPDLSLSFGPYAQYTYPLSSSWDLNALVNPGVAWIDERVGRDPEVVPDISARLGVSRDGAKYRTLIEVFYGQGRFTGYRSYGMNLSFSALGWLGRARPGHAGSADTPTERSAGSAIQGYRR